ncbi:MAG: Type 2 DNA topoisomerase 6 subunit A [Candidatus Thorarchaeota archaeon]|nr:MAG: Type 2 DNA topoisomerase 6 subunit A [Candidatus Thorarchaeota archaeon]
MSESSKENSLEKLRALGARLIESICDGKFPSIQIPDRSTANIHFDSELNHFTLGDGFVIRDSSNIKHIRSFAQLVWVASFAKNLLQSGRTSSLRDLYYSAEAFDIDFKNQAESDRIVTDLECAIGLAREEFAIYSEEHSSIFGEVTMEYTAPGYEGRQLDLTVSPDGLPIGPAIMTAEPLHTDANRILAVESGGIFSRLIESHAWRRFGSILVHLGGQPPRSTRKLLRKLTESLDIPLYIFTDGDPWGMHIAQVIISGSANAAHIPHLTVPSAEWIGITPQDIVDYKLPSETLKGVDLKRLDELSNDVRYTSTFWQDHIREFKEVRKKAEQQAFSRYGIDFVVDTYLPDKLSLC